MTSANRYIAETSIYIRYAETDAMGIVHHSNHIVFFEEGRSNYARLRGSDYASIERSGYYLTVAEVNARYLKPAVYGQQVTIRCWIEEMKSRSVTFGYEIVDTPTGELHVSGSTKHICITHEGKVTHIPEAWRQWADHL